MKCTLSPWLAGKLAVGSMLVRPAMDLMECQEACFFGTERRLPKDAEGLFFPAAIGFLKYRGGGGRLQ